MKVHANAANAYAVRAQPQERGGANLDFAANGESPRAKPEPVRSRPVAAEPAEPAAPPTHRGQALDLRI